MVAQSAAREPAIAVVCAILVIEFRFHGLHNVTVTSSLLLAILYFAVRWDRLETIVASVVACTGISALLSASDRKLQGDGPAVVRCGGRFLDYGDRG